MAIRMVETRYGFSLSGTGMFNARKLNKLIKSQQKRIEANRLETAEAQKTKDATLKVRQPANIPSPLVKSSRNPDFTKVRGRHPEDSIVLTSGPEYVYNPWHIDVNAPNIHKVLKIREIKVHTRPNKGGSGFDNIPVFIKDTLNRPVVTKVVNSGQTITVEDINYAESGWVEQLKLTASDREPGDAFGHSVAISGNTIVVGAVDEGIQGSGGGDMVVFEGAAYVFIRTESDWVEQVKLTASDREPGDAFGHSVAIDGDTLVIGAPFEEPFGPFSPDAGSAYIFTRSGSVWTEQTKIVASVGGGSFSFFGYSVSISGDTVVVGTKPEGEDTRGNVYVFTRTGSVWTEQGHLTASDAESNDFFGTSVAINGDIIVVGAPGEDPNGIINAGSAYVFTRTGSVWTEQVKLIASDREPNDAFGQSVAIDGDTVVVGVQNEDPGELSNAGSAYVFTRSGSIWTEQVKFTASDKEPFDFFGRSVSINGDTIIVGTNREDPNGIMDAGSAYVFTRTGSVWTEQAKLVASDKEMGDQFGTSVAINGDTIVTGAAFEDPNGITNAGSAYVFNLSPPSIPDDVRVILPDEAFGPELVVNGTFDIDTDWVKGSGWSISNGKATVDGTQTTDTVLSQVINTEIGEYYIIFFELTDVSSGSVSVLFGGEVLAINLSQPGFYRFFVKATQVNQVFEIQATYGIDWELQQILTAFSENQHQDYINDPKTGGFFGHSLAIDGNVCVVGAPFSNEVCIFMRDNPNDVWEKYQRIAPFDDGIFTGSSDYFGYIVATDGVNLVVAAKDAIYTFISEIVTTNNHDIFVWQNEKIISLPGLSNNFNWTETTVPDVNIAVHDDVIVVGVPSLNKIYIYIRSGNDWIEHQIDGHIPITGDLFGHAVAIHEDKILVGAPGEVNGGAAYLFTRSPLGNVWTKQHRFDITPTSDTGFGYSVALNENNIVVGAYKRREVYIYKEVNNIWEVQMVTEIGESFGFSVNISDAVNHFPFDPNIKDAIIVGSHRFGDVNHPSGQHHGQSYIYEEVAGIWTLKQELVSFNLIANNFFGYSNTVSVETALVGAIGNDISGKVDAGMVYLYNRKKGTFVGFIDNVSIKKGVAVAVELLFDLFVGPKKSFIDSFTDDVLLFQNHVLEMTLKGI